LIKLAPDGYGTDGATSSEPHGMSLSTTMDDDVFTTLREDEVVAAAAAPEGETISPDSQGEASERSVVKVSPGSVRQEVSQAIIDKKGTLIILKEAEDKAEAVDKTAAGDGVAAGDQTADDRDDRATAEVDATEPPVGEMEDLANDENEVPSVSDEEDAVPATEKEEAFGSRGVILGPDDAPLKMESRHMEVTRIKGISSPTRAKASWVSEVVKTVERSEFTSMSAKEGEQWQVFKAGAPKDVFIFEEAPAGKPGADFTAAAVSTVTELSTASLEVVPYISFHRKSGKMTRASFSTAHPPPPHPHTLSIPPPPPSPLTLVLTTGTTTRTTTTTTTTTT